MADFNIDNIPNFQGNLQDALYFALNSIIL